jgi:predicted  nucleic acid-binding Zn-ribbon protein
MQNLENAQNAAAQLQSDDTETTQKLADAIQARDDVFADIDFEIKSLTTQRTEISGSLPADLIAMYDKIRSDHGGIGAAMIQRRTCHGCNLTIDAQELDKIRGLPPEVIVRCDECRRILVRTVESGL